MKGTQSIRLIFGKASANEGNLIVTYGQKSSGNCSGKAIVLVRRFDLAVPGLDCGNERDVACHDRKVALCAAQAEKYSRTIKNIAFGC